MNHYLQKACSKSANIGFSLSGTDGNSAFLVSAFPVLSTSFSQFSSYIKSSVS